MSRLSFDDIAAIRASARSHRRLAELYGVSRGTIRSIRSGWRGKSAMLAKGRGDHDEIWRELVMQMNAVMRRSLARLEAMDR